MSLQNSLCLDGGSDERLCGGGRVEAEEFGIVEVDEEAVVVVLVLCHRVEMRRGERRNPCGRRS